MRRESNRIDALRAKKAKCLPTVLTRDEVYRAFAHLSGVDLLMAWLLYGSDLQRMACLRLRVRDCDSPQADGHATACACVDPVCRAPVTEPETLLELIE